MAIVKFTFSIFVSGGADFIRRLLLSDNSYKSRTDFSSYLRRLTTARRCCCESGDCCGRGTHAASHIDLEDQRVGVQSRRMTGALRETRAQPLDISKWVLQEVLVGLTCKETCGDAGSVGSTAAVFERAERPYATFAPGTSSARASSLTRAADWVLKGWWAPRKQRRRTRKLTARLSCGFPGRR